MKILSVSHLSQTFPLRNEGRGHHVLSDLSIEFHAEKVSVILGPSGCGKTTLLNLLAGLLSPSSGEIEFHETLSGERRTIGYVFQTPSLIPWRTVRENALFGAEIAGNRTAETESRCDEMLRSYGLAGFEGSYTGALSGGMQQRLSIIRAVLSGAKTVLLDEPFSNSDFLIQRELQFQLSHLVTNEQLIAIMVTHDIEEAVRIGDKVIVLTERPARVKAEVEIPIPREQRVNGGASVMKELATYVEMVEHIFGAPPELFDAGHRQQ